MRRLERDGSPLMRAMLRAGREEVPSPSLAASTCRALGITTGIVGVVGSTATAKAASAVGIAALAKWVGVGLIAGLGVMFAAAQLSPPAPRAAEPVAAPRRAAPEPAPVQAAAPPVVPNPAPTRRAEPLRPAASSDPPPVVSTLAAEARLLERARQALSDGDAAQARQALDQYDREFPLGDLASEAAYLRMEAFGRHGDRQAAAAAAERLLRDHPDSPHAPRARSLAGTSEP
jgi:TolA-binding protein